MSKSNCGGSALHFGSAGWVNQIIRGGLASDLVQTVQEVLTHFQMYGWMNIDILIALDFRCI